MSDDSHFLTFENLIRQFECSWSSGSPPKISDYLHDDISTQRRIRLIQELICLDLEFSWKLNECKRTIEDYLIEFPELETEKEYVLELIGEEYRVLSLWGEKPTIENYRAHFPAYERDIENYIKSVSKELSLEENGARVRAVSKFEAATSVIANESRAVLSYEDYLLQKLIGSGQSSKVYRALRRSDGELVSVKFLRKSLLEFPEAIQSFSAEAELVSKLDHPGILSVHGLGRTPSENFFLVMDWIDGSDLAEVINRDRSLDHQTAVRWTRTICLAIDHAHQSGIVHCDLKPSNVLLDRQGNVCITDFGLARSIRNDPPRLEALQGTAPFMAPEQVSEYWGNIGVKTDLYSLGALLYNLLTGQPPWSGRTLADVLSKVVSSSEVIPPHLIVADVPRRLSQICCKALANSPDQRFSNAIEIYCALEPFDWSPETS